MISDGRYQPKSDPLIPHGCPLDDGGRQISERPICWGEGVIRLNGLGGGLAQLPQLHAGPTTGKFGKPQQITRGDLVLLDP